MSLKKCPDVRTRFEEEVPETTCPPDALSRRGITHATDNAGGKRVSAARSIWLWYGADLQRAFIKRGG